MLSPLTTTLARSAGWIAWLLIVFGAGLRAHRFLFKGSFWIDEAALALNISARSFGELLQPLALAQSAPILFLWIERAVAVTIGPTEYALRALPFVAAVLTLPVFWRLAVRVATPPTALVALALVVLSPSLIRYSSELRPYTLDALITVVLLHLALDVSERPDDGRAWWRLAAGGVAAIAVSMPVALVLPGIVMAFPLIAWRADSTTQRRALLTATTWGAAVILVHRFFYFRSLGPGTPMGAYMARGWHEHFLNTDPPGLSFRLWTGAREVVIQPLIEPLLLVPKGATLAVGLLAAGAALVLRTRGRVAAALVIGPPTLLLFAAAVDAYPLSRRLTMFVTPVLAILFACGVRALALPLRGRVGSAVFAALAFLVIGAAATTSLARVIPKAASPIPLVSERAMVHRLATEAPESEPVYVYAGAIPVWLFYTTEWSRPRRNRVSWMMGVADLGGPAFNNALSRGRRVIAEGDDLIWNDGRRPEIMGIPPGIWNDEMRVYGTMPDSGWRENEIRRILGVARPCARLYFSHLLRVSPAEQLVAGAEAAGGRVVWRLDAPRARAFRICFDGPRASG